MRMLTASVLLIVTLGACSSSPPDEGAQSSAGQVDADFDALQERGETAMGVDQYTSTHLFDALPDGGRIELQRDDDDPAGVDRIREHLRQVALDFADGDFSDPTFVHQQEMPGTAVMALRKDAIVYTFASLPRGAEVRITTEDPGAIEAIHQFMAAQRMDHRAGGHDHH
jgi:hypothetical protein